MGRFNWRQILSVIIRGACALSLNVGAAAAFTTERYMTVSLTYCGPDRNLAPWGDAFVYPAGTNTLAGGSQWYNPKATGEFSDAAGSIAINSGNPITEDLLVSCLDDYTPNTLVQKGADAPTFAEQTIMGYGYLSNVSSEWVDIIIGSGTLKPTTSGQATDLVANMGDEQVSVAFTAPADTIGAPITDYEYELDDNGTWTSASATSSPVMITGLTNGTSYSIKLRAVSWVGDGAESAAVSFGTPSPATAFDQYEGEIRAVIVNDVTRSLQSTMSANDRMIRDARGRFIDSQRQSSVEEVTVSSCSNVAFDVDGTAQVSGTTVSTRGTFFGQTGGLKCTQQRLFFGDFDVQHDGDTNSTTATITARMAWEQMYTDSTMLGYFVGGELAHSNIKGSFEGEQDRLGVSFGGYAVHQLDEQVFVDGFITVGAGRNNLEIADATLDLTSDYTTRTATMGAAVSGVYEYGQYDFHPELAFSYGKTWIGDVGFTGVAYGLTDDTLSLDAGDVSIANLTLRPGIVWALDAETIADSNTQLSFAPRFICQRTSAAATTQDSGAGAEIGLSSTSEDGLSSANIRLVMDRVGNSNRSSFALNFDRRF